MGTLFYGPARAAINIDDRVLAHLKLVTTAKLRRNEPFLLSWSEGQDMGGGRVSVWIHPACDLIYRFDGGKAPELDRDLIEAMSTDTHSATGLHIEASLTRFWGLT